jgi:hypothetical protein
MKNKIAGALIFLSIAFVFLLLFPIEREVTIKIKNASLRDLNEVSVSFYLDNKEVMNRRYFFKDNKAKYYTEINGRYRLKTGIYNVIVVLVYKDYYLQRNILMSIDLMDFTYEISI